MADQENVQQGRRRLIRTLGGAGGGILLANAWHKPVVDSVIVPAHAQLSLFSGTATFGTGPVTIVDAGHPLLDLVIPAAYALYPVAEAFNVCVTAIDFAATIEVKVCSNIICCTGIYEATGVDISAAFNEVLTFSSGLNVGVLSISGQVEPDGGSFKLSGILTQSSGSTEFVAYPGGGCGAPTCSCFLAGTSVWMADGSRKAIEEVVVGDMVASHDFTSGRRIASPVTKLHRAAAPDYIDLDGLLVTGRHPFAVGHDLWKPAAELGAGDVVQGGNGAIQIGNAHAIHQATDVFNLRVEGTHNYYVGDQRQMYLVHNKA